MKLTFIQRDNDQGNKWCHHRAPNQVLVIEYSVKSERLLNGLPGKLVELLMSSSE